MLYIVSFLKSKKNNEHTFMDVKYTNCIKGFSILTVIWAHTGAKLDVEAIQFIAGIGVSLFIICSGHGLELSYQKNGLKGFWKKRFFRVVMPYWIVELVGMIIYNEFSIRNFFKRMLLIDGRWFIQYIMICYLLFFIEKKISEKFGFSIIQQWTIIFIMFCTWFFVDSIFMAQEGMPFLRARQMLAFPFGIYLAQKRGLVEEYAAKHKLGILFGGIILATLFMYITQLPCIKSLPFLIQNFFSLPTVFVYALVVLLFSDIFRLILENAFLKYMGIISYEVFLIHAYTVRILDVGTYAKVVLMFVLTVVLAGIMNKISREIEQRR